MISLFDATTLAIAKVKTKPARTVATVTIASLIFAIIVAGSLVLNGFINSVDKASQDSLSRRYIVQVNKPLINSGTTSVFRDKDLIEKAKQRFDSLIEQKKLRAQQLGIDYNEASEVPPTDTNEFDDIERLAFRDSNNISHTVLAEKYSSKSPIDDDLLQKRANNYGAIDLYAAQYRTTPAQSSLSFLADGHEKFYDISDEQEYNANHVPDVLQPQYELLPEEIAEVFLFTNSGSWSADDGTIPLIVPANIAEQLLGFDKLPTSADHTEKSDRLASLRSEADGYKFKACYRNQSSSELIQQTIIQNKAAQAKDKDQSYTKPPIEYSLPDDSQCANPTVKADNRSDSQIDYDKRLKEFNQEFTDDTDPESFFVNFTIVGLAPYEVDESSTASGNVSRTFEDILHNLVSPSQVAQSIPQQMFDQIPNEQAHKDIFVYEPFYIMGADDGKQRLVEFANASDAQRFIDEQSCTQQYDGLCKPAGRDYTASLAFSNSAALDDIRQKTERWFYLAAAGAVLLAAITMWLTISRTIASSRHETAMLRAIGFSRLDISLIYSAYTLILAALTGLVMLVLGFGFALIVNHLYAPLVTSQLQYLFINALTPDMPLLKVEIQQLLLLVAACVLASLLAMIIPVMRNVRRNPMQDMRDEA